MHTTERYSFQRPPAHASTKSVHSVESACDKSCLSSQMSVLRSQRQGRSGSVKEKGYFRNAIAENILKRIPLINEEFKNSLEQGKKTQHAKMPALAAAHSAAKENNNRWVTSDNKPPPPGRPAPNN